MCLRHGQLTLGFDHAQTATPQRPASSTPSAPTKINIAPAKSPAPAPTTTFNESFADWQNGVLARVLNVTLSVSVYN